MDFHSEFPNLQTIELALNNELGRIDAEIKKEKTNERYADNEAERKYVLKELADEREQTLANAETNYHKELEATELSLADRAFQPVEVSDEARETVAAITTSVTSSLNPVDTLYLLNVKARSMEDDAKALLASELATIEEVAQGKARNNGETEEVNRYLDEIKQTIADTKQAQNISEQREALQRIKNGTASIRMEYDARDSAINKPIERRDTPFDGVR